VNERFRIYAAVGLAGVVTLVGGFLFLGRGGGGASPSAAPVIKPLHAQRTARAKARRTVPAKATPTRAAKPLHKAKPKRAATPRHHAVTQPTDGMPAEVSAALAKHRVVVIALVTPRAAVDELTLREAKAGADEASAGFVTISVANDADVQALSQLVNGSAAPQDRLLDAPAVLVVRRPQQLFVRFNGFTDADTVAQAAANALLGASD
jgi:hypothetical protein